MVLGEMKSRVENSDHHTVYECLKPLAINYRFRPGQQLMIGQLYVEEALPKTSL